MIDPIIILLALAAGLTSKRLGYPPLLGYILSGFLLSGLDIQAGDIVENLSTAGVTLLLFSIGLKLNLRELAAVQVWGVATAHMAVSVVLGVAVISLVAPFVVAFSTLEPAAMWTIAFALSFSSTVLAVKVFEERGETASIHARITIGILIMQDMAAVVYLSMMKGEPPLLSGLLLLLLIPCRPLFIRLMKFCGHDELLILYGFAMAFGGYALFEVFNLKGDLGALAMGVLLAGHLKANELAKSLFNLKDLFLIGFFLSIGLGGLPGVDMIIIAAILAVLCVIKPLLFFFMMVGLKLRARTSLLASLALHNYSEFGLVVGVMAVQAGLLSQEWLITIALALSLSFLLTVPINARAHWFYHRYGNLLCRFERAGRLPEETPLDIGETSIVILGMGRVGSGAYEYLRELHGDTVLGVEENVTKLPRLKERGYRVVRGDASDQDFWQQLKLDQLDLILVSLTNHNENMDVCDMVESLGYQGRIAVVARYPDELAELTERGHIAFNLYAEAGHGFAEHVMTSVATEADTPLTADQ